MEGQEPKVQSELSMMRLLFCMLCHRPCTVFRSQWIAIQGTEAEDGGIRFTSEIDHFVSRAWTMRGEAGSRCIGELG